MKKEFLCFISILVFGLLFCSIAVGGGYRSLGIGTRALSKGGAFIGESNHWTAIYWNPAGLAQLDGAEIGLEPHYLYVHQVDSNSMKNYDLMNYSAQQGDAFLRIYNLPGVAVEPTMFNAESAIYSDISCTTSLGGHIDLKYFDLGFGLYTPIGIGTDWNDTVYDLVNGASIDAEYLNKISVYAFNLSAAKDISPYFSLGVGLNYLYGQGKVDVEKRYTSALAPLLNYSFDYNLDVSGDGIEGVFGILITPNEVISIGGVYRTGSKMTLSGDAQIKHTTLGVSEKSDVDRDWNFPASCGLGLSFKPKEKWTINLDWDYTFWHKEELDLDFDLVGGALLVDTKVDYDYKDSNTVHLGIEYKWNPNLSLMGGFIWDQTPVPDEAVSIATVVDMDKIYFTAGLGYSTKRWDFNVGYGYGFGDRDADGVDYELNIHNIMAGATYHF